MIEIAIYLAIAVLTAGVMIGIADDPDEARIWILAGLLWPIFLAGCASCLLADGIKYLRRLCR